MRYWLILVGLLVCTCSKEHDRQLYIGELYFSPFRYGNFYNLDSKSRLKVEHIMDTSRFDKADSAQRVTIEVYHKLKAGGLLFKPFVDLRVTDSTYAKLYLDSSDYDRIKIYKRGELIGKHKKVVIWGRTRVINDYAVFPLLYCTELIDIELTDGQTYLEKEDKFRIDDYN